MIKESSFASRFIADESGQGITEYGAILAFVAILVALVFSLTSGALKCSISNSFSAVVTQLNNLSSAAS
jgi:Flp pilus assembly pilin Flp